VPALTLGHVAPGGVGVHGRIKEGVVAVTALAASASAFAAAGAALRKRRERPGGAAGGGRGPSAHLTSLIASPHRLWRLRTKPAIKPNIAPKILYVFLMCFLKFTTVQKLKTCLFTTQVAS